MTNAKMGTLMSDHQFQAGDQVRHAQRPEWGVGTVVRVEDLAANAEHRREQRLVIRFPNVGLKTLSSAHAPLQRFGGDSGDRHPVAVWEKVGEESWLGSVARKKIEEAMVSLPLDARDPFIPLSKRLSFTLDLYRFGRSGRSLSDWAVAQSGLDDPLTRFTRHELEQFFDRWAAERDSHLARLLQGAPLDPRLVNDALEAAPPQARGAVRRLTAAR